MPCDFIECSFLEYSPKGIVINRCLFSACSGLTIECNVFDFQLQPAKC